MRFYIVLTTLFLAIVSCTNKPVQKNLETDYREPQSENPILTRFDSPEVLDLLDKNQNSTLALNQIFNLIQNQNNQAAVAIASVKNNELLKFTNTYAVFTETLSSDVQRIVQDLALDWEKDITKTYDVNSAKTAEGKVYRQNGNVLRVFNEKWLSSADGQFILSGIVNRLDRMHFASNTCGEVRFIYRLGYEVQMQNETYASRTPLTLNMVFTVKNDGAGCATVAEAWRRSKIISADGNEATVANLLNGPLNFKNLIFKQMEVNAQVARFPSDLENVTNRKLAGQAIYWMRIFAVQQNKFVAQKLENTPDVVAIKNSAAKKESLKNYLVSNMAGVDKGVYKIPEDLLTDIAISYSTSGSARLANRPFDSIFTEAEAEDMLRRSGVNAGVFAIDGNSVLERLNTSTCMGCHQTSSTAGFHFLGRDRFGWAKKPELVKQATDGNRLEVAFSSHFYADVVRRKIFLEKVALGDSNFDFRPHPAAPPLNASGVKFVAAQSNAPCLVNSLGSSSQWACQGGMTCTSVTKNKDISFEIGHCLPAKNQIFAGLSCRSYEVSNQTEVSQGLLAYNLKAYKDKVISDRQLYNLPEGPVAADYNCRPTRIGVPHGRVTKACSNSARSLQNVTAEGKRPDEICAVVGGKLFEVMARGYFSSKKLAEGAGRGMLNTCGPDNFCSEDYICQQVPDFLQSSRYGVTPAAIQRIRGERIGYCTPTYFVYQLRLDGHPNPR